MDIKTRLTNEIENCQKMIDSFELEWLNGDTTILYWQSKKELAEQLLSEEIEKEELKLKRLKKRFKIFEKYLTQKVEFESGEYKDYLLGQKDAMTFAKESIEEELGRSESTNGNYSR